MKFLQRIIVFGCLSLSATVAHATEIYVGPAASFGTAVPAGAGSNNQRADTIASLTYIYYDGIYTAPTAQTIVVNQVDLANQSDGTITPFLARYTGGSTSSGASYKLLVTGDTFSVTGGGTLGALVNAAFTVSGINPTISLAAGDVIVAGLYQSSTNVVFAPGTSAALIDRNDTIPGSVGSAFPSGSNFFFNGLAYRFNIGFSVGGSSSVPEPAGLAIMATGIAGLAYAARRRRGTEVTPSTRN